MLITLGFLAALLLALMAAPVFWARAVRLTRRRMQDAMPLTEAEIRADKDRIRAEHALRVHQLETRLGHVEMGAARQKIELSRRDATINEFESEREHMRSALEEAQNARRVLEQTVSDRLPRVELRLTEARKMLFNRDHEISELTRTADRQGRALSEAATINAQQLTEIERLASSLSARGERGQDGPRDQRIDSEVALRSELEALRAKTRDQSQLINRLLSRQGRNGDGDVTGPRLTAVEANGSDKPETDVGVSDDARAKLDAEIRTLKARAQDQAGEIARLKAAVAVFEGADGDEQKFSIRDSKIGLKARLSAIEAQNEQQKDTIAKARTELAAANEKLARQAAHFTSELKRLGAGTLPASGQPRRAEPRVSLAERVANMRPAAPANPAPAPEDVKASNGDAGLNGLGSEGPSEKIKVPSGDASESTQAGPSEDLPGEAKAADDSKTPAAEPVRKGRLLERISSLAKTS
jgi:uncharacterized coiled-coil protein SlyX